GARPEGLGVLLQATDGPLRELASSRLGHVQQSLADHLGSIAQRAFRGLVGYLGLSAQQGTRALVRGVGTQQFEHVRVIVHGGYPWYVGKQRLWPLLNYIGLTQTNSSSMLHIF